MQQDDDGWYSIVNDPEVLLQNWAEHFEKIATSREDKVDKFRN